LQPCWQDQSSEQPADLLLRACTFPYSHTGVLAVQEQLHSHHHVQAPAQQRENYEVPNLVILVDQEEKSM